MHQGAQKDAWADPGDTYQRIAGHGQRQETEEFVVHGANTGWSHQAKGLYAWCMLNHCLNCHIAAERMPDYDGRA